jgi:serine/threonine protein kinase/Tol biopolymer transport system component
MDAAYWVEVNRLFLLLLDLSPPERGSELARCSDDSLRRDVETLLKLDSEPSLIDEPVFELVAELLGNESQALAGGEYFGHYRIIDLIGAGGMGQVYLAHDSNLGRRVALKLLPSEFNVDDERTRRFQQEARAASALNHPNILTIYEIGQFDGSRFIATEFIEGKTLRDCIRESRLDARSAVDVATQIANALGAAHEAGIVHRDIKPENVMLRPDGYAKVLDFGLAKLTESESSQAVDAPMDRLETRPGLLLGTVKYMSPEQARGLSVDGRSDIFSLGVVLYEMTTGRAPFEGETTSDLIASILTAEPAPLGDLAPETPAALQKIVAKALSKNRDDRYESADDLLHDLKALNHELQLEPKLARLTPRPGGANWLAVLPGYFGDRLRVNVALFAVGVLVLTAAGYGFYSYVRGRSAPFEKIQMVRLTTTGRASAPVISPDGRYVAYADWEKGKSGIWITQVATLSRQLLAPSGYFASFSPDGNYLYYIAKLADDTQQTLYRIPVLGGRSERIMSGVDSAPKFSNDGSRMAFLRESSDRTLIMLANPDGSSEKHVSVKKSPDLSSRLAWSSDGRRLVFARNGQDAKGVYGELVQVDLESEQEETITHREWDFIYDVDWSWDGRFLVISAESEAGQGIWTMAPTGEGAALVTTGLDRLTTVRLTQDSSTLVTMQSNPVYNIHVRDSSLPTDAVRVTFGSATMDGWCGIAWAPDGRIIYSSEASGRPDIWSMNADGSDRRQLTFGLGSGNRGLSVSPDGRYIAFVSRKGGLTHIWRVDSSGANPRQLTEGNGEFNPFFAPDGMWVYYGDGGDRPKYSKVPIDGGESVQVASPYSDVVSGGISPDSMWLAVRPPELPVQSRKIGVVSAKDGKVARILSLPRILAWTVDARALTFKDRRTGAENLWLQPIDGSDPSQLTYFKEDDYDIHSFAWSRDGRYLALSRGRFTTDIVLIKSVE